MKLLPGELQIQGLLALMELQASRTRARTGQNAKPFCCWIKTGLGGTTFRYGEEWPHFIMRNSWVAERATTRCRRHHQ